MKKTIYLILFLSLSNFMKAQVLFSFVGVGTEHDAMKHMETVSSDEENIAAGYQFYSDKLGDTLLLSVTGHESIIRKLTFNGKKNKCDFDQVNIPNCGACSEKQLNVILNDRKMQWREVSKDEYWSDVEHKTILMVTYDENNICTVLTFKESTMEKDEYLGIYQKHNSDYTTADYAFRAKKGADLPK